MSRVACIGLGGMGSRMAARLLDAGHELTVWNRTAEKASPLAERGASVAKTPTDAARDAEAVITMLANPDALREVTPGIAAGVTDASTVIEMSTVGPAAVHELRVALHPEVGLLDAPVLGSLSEAESGSLHIFVGGNPMLFALWAPLLADLGNPIHAGPLCAGAAAKLVANSTLFGTLGVLGEALALADALGLDREAAFDVLAATPLADQAERRRPGIESGEFPPRFPLRLARKDADLVSGASDAELRLADAARSWLVEADDGSWGEQDYSSLLAWILKR
jgi:3-hydroxyisobutyrate dehydrogenase-like beta-hydroxyacid dehydrogenase